MVRKKEKRKTFASKEKVSAMYVSDAFFFKFNNQHCSRTFQSQIGKQRFKMSENTMDIKKKFVILQM